MTLTIDARGLACPQPVVLTNNAFDESDEVITIVDDEIARENVSRLAQSKGFDVEVEESDGAYYLHLKRKDTATGEVGNSYSSSVVLFISSDAIGCGSEDLGQKLMIAFVQVLHEIIPQPETIIFMNSGVKLVAEGSKVIEDLQVLENQGVELLACGTCLRYYELNEKVAAGQVSNMYDIVSSLFNAGKVISP